MSFIEILDEREQSLLSCSTKKGVDFLKSRLSRLGDPSSLDFKHGDFDVDLEDGIHAASKMDAGEPLPRPFRCVEKDGMQFVQLTLLRPSVHELPRESSRRTPAAASSRSSGAAEPRSKGDKGGGAVHASWDNFKTSVVQELWPYTAVGFPHKAKQRVPAGSGEFKRA